MRLTLKLRKRSHSPYWYLEGQVNGQRFQESLRTKNRRHAQRLLELRYQELLAGTARTHKNLLATVVEQYLEGYAKVRKRRPFYDASSSALEPPHRSRRSPKLTSTAISHGANRTSPMPVLIERST